MEPEPSTIAQAGPSVHRQPGDEVTSVLGRRQRSSDETARQETGRNVRTRAEASQQPAEPPPDWLPPLSLTVIWQSTSGSRSKVTHLPLNVMPRWDCATGLHKRLLARVFSSTEQPASLTCADYLQFNTSEECLNYPMDIARTTYRLVAEDANGWQFVIHESKPQPHQPRTTQDFLHVVSIEFETVARIIGHLGIRMSMIAYPVVAINKAMLQSAVNELRTNPNFKGIL